MGGMYGPGDWQTWGACEGHTSDPRTVDDDETPVLASDAAVDLAGRADRAWQRGDMAAAADLYRDAAQQMEYAASLCVVLS